MSAETEGGMRKRRLGQKQKAKFLALLMEMQNDVVAKCEGFVPGVVQTGDRCDVAQQETFVQLDLSRRQGSIKRMNEIKRARQRIESGTYGVCVICEENIPVKRLECRPTAEKCLDCQREEEAAKVRQTGKRPAYVVV